MHLGKYSRILLLLPALCLLSCMGCGAANKGFVTISAQEAKQLMDKEQGYVIVDVREPEEYKEGHIPNSLLLPLGTVEQDAEKVLKDKGQLILVHCRSGKRSKVAAEKLVKLGYTKVKDFGGLLDWPYEVVK